VRRKLKAESRLTAADAKKSHWSEFTKLVNEFRVHSEVTR